MTRSTLRRNSASLPAHRLAPLCALLAALPLSALAEESTLPTVTVHAPTPAAQPLQPTAETLAERRAAGADTAALLQGIPGISLQGAGGVSSLPSVHGMTDDRLRIQLDGMDLVSSCGNHMNPPLSYVDPSRVSAVRVFTGTAPVSVGGDSIGASILVETAPLVFAAPGQGPITRGEVGAWARSNGKGLGGHASATYATDQFSLRYDGSTAQSGNFHAARAFKAAGPAGADKPDRILAGDEVGSSSYRARNQSLSLAFRGDDSLLGLEVGMQDVPYQNFPNQRMDMTRNDSTHLNLRYQRSFAWGDLQARAWHEQTRHAMDFGPDKQYLYGGGKATGMPMDTRGSTSGAKLSGDIALSDQSTLRAGAEALRYRLDDWWMPSGGGMAPDIFRNIADGQRDRFDVYGEWETRWSPAWVGQIGLRSSQVRSNSGEVQGYNASYGAEAAAFNAKDRSRSDHNLDLSALARYTPNESSSYEFGFSRKTRSPNLYERFAWSTGGMAMRMVNLAGDGNGYVGNPDLLPETAHTLSATADWHDASGQRWGLRLTPWISQVHNYIDAKRCSGSSGMMSACNAANVAAQQKFVYLRFANADARLWGFDISGFMDLGKNDWLGALQLDGALSQTWARNRDTGDGLYNTMPLHARLALTQQRGAWSSTAEVLLVAAKTRVSAERNELATTGYGLLNLRSSYQWQNWRLDLGIDNLLDRYYAHPQGGAYVGQGATMGGTAVPWGISVPGMGRSFKLGLSMQF
ncbi:MAG: TonB-dependent receptor [Simplicispira suum]|uniref:TonB-dependent receptor n=1 Tax=Simplicispira suum TaxID=2109915 RepID=UPI001C6C8671|nr:TonB-dependent receptor [Simplicispira suum]MBW7831679.1 TonB-dependent receptor [Simplicispira suum]